MDSTSTPKRKKSSLSSEGDGGKRPKHHQSVLPVEEGGSQSLLLGEEVDQGDNAGGGGEVALMWRSLLLGEEVDQRDNAGGGGGEVGQGDNTGGGGEVGLKKGPWTKEEDEILVDHINKYGEGNWKAVQKNSGLARDGKSCRLRWLNHLRPGLKKGSFTDEEVRLILEFHFLKGGKWAQMAAMLPGRTDNEIKNFWYARIRKQERKGLSIYPDEITSKYSLNGSQESVDTLANEPSQPDETQNFHLDITDLDLKDFKFYPDMLPPPDYKPISDLVGRSYDSSHNTLPVRRAAVVRNRYLICADRAAAVPAAVVRNKYLICADRAAAVPEVFDQYGKYPMLSTPCDPILNPTAGFHAASNISSFQNSQNQQCTRSGMNVPFESVDMPVPASPDCSHLIDSTVYYNSDQNLKGSSFDSLQANRDSSAPNEADISTQWNELDDDQHAAYNQMDQLNFSRWFHSQR